MLLNCKWNGHVTNLLTGISNFKTAENYVDATLICSGVEIKVHKLVLSMCSQLFHDMFQSNPCAHPIIILQDMKLSTLQTVIDFMYRGEINIQNDDLELFLKASEALQIKGLSDICKKMLPKTLISGTEERFKSNTVSMNDSSSNSSPEKKNPRKRSLSIDEDLNMEGDPNPTKESMEFNPQITETCSVPRIAASSGSCANKAPKSTSASELEDVPTENSAPENSEKGSSAEKQSTPERKETLPSTQIGGANGTTTQEKGSRIWNYFTPISGSMAKCNTCHINRSYRMGTTTLKKHLRSDHPSLDDLYYEQEKKNPEVEGDNPNAPGTAKEINPSELNGPGNLCKRKKRSRIWKYFTPQGKMMAQCNVCKEHQSYRSSSSNLKKHLLRRHPFIKFNSSDEETSEVPAEPTAALQEISEVEKPRIKNLADRSRFDTKDVSTKTQAMISDVQAEVKEEVLDDVSESFQQATAEVSESFEHAKAVTESSTVLKGLKQQVKKRTSFLWNYFTPINHQLAMCRLCSVHKSYRTTVSNLKKHLIRSHPTINIPNSTQNLVPKTITQNTVLLIVPSNGESVNGNNHGISFITR